MQAIQIEFLGAMERGEHPDGWLRRYPQYAASLIDLAQAYAVEAAAPPPDAAEIAAVAAIARRTLAASSLAAPLGLGERAARAGTSLRELAARVGLSSDVIFKIDRRIVRPETVPAALLRELASALGCTAIALRAGLLGGPATAGAMYHAAQPPKPRQQSFAEAIAASADLSPEARARWLAAAAAPDEG
ncbi:MAG: hypothetical protein ACR2M0_10360 [Chloroflexia bacterium]